MRFFVVFFAVLTGLCLYFLLTDARGSGMGWALGISAGILAGVLVYNKLARGGWLSNLTRAAYLEQLRATATATSTQPGATTEADLAAERGGTYPTPVVSDDYRPRKDV